MKIKSIRLLSTLLTFALVFSLFTTKPPVVTAQDSPAPPEDDTLLAEYIAENYPGEITVAIAALRPIANSRVAFDINNMSAGHTAIRLDFGDGNVMVRGYTVVDDMSLQNIVYNKTVEGILKDEPLRDWNAAIVYEITLDQANKIRDYIDNFDNDHFNLIFNNCTTFAVNALAAARIVPPTQEHYWTLPARDEIIADISSIAINKEMFTNALMSRIYYGYTPADAVQDFKSDANCILKYNGTLHKP